jgi:hypothetical protein
VRHITPASLDQLEDLLTDLRAVPGLREKSRGVFYRKSKAFLHFHEDPTGFFADVRFDVDFERVSVSAVAEQRALAERVRSALTRSSM